MSRVVAIGDELTLLGYALAGVEVLPAIDDLAVRAAWNGLGADVGLVLLTAPAAATLERELDASGLLWAVLPG